MIMREVNKNPTTTQRELMNELQRAGTKVTKVTISHATLRGTHILQWHECLLKPVRHQAGPYVRVHASEHMDDQQEFRGNSLWSKFNWSCLDEEDYCLCPSAKGTGQQLQFVQTWGRSPGRV